MATLILLHVHSAEMLQSPLLPAGVMPEQANLLRRERGFVQGSDGACVLTCEGLRGARGVAAALLFEILAIVCVCSAWLAWHWLR